MRRALPLFICLAISVAAMAASIGASKTSDGDAIVAVFPPWWSAARTFYAAGETGAILNNGAFPFVVVVQSASAGLDVRLRAAGALLLLDPLGLGGCLGYSIRKSHV
jgi:hypothetical protein